MEEFITKFSDLFIHYYSNKSRSTCKLFISTPSSAEESTMGKVFGIIEINTPNRDNANIIAQIITEIEESYYSDNNNDNNRDDFKVVFERALMKANKKFNELIENHPTYLVGTLDQHSIKEKMNLVVGILRGNKLLLSPLNSVGAFLIHKTKQDYTIIDIAGSEEEDSENTNIFSNIISGELQSNDYFFLCNKDFLEFITQERIRKITSSLPPHKATEYFKNALLQHEGYNFAAIIIQQQIREPEEVDVPESLSSIDDLNATESSTEQLLSPSFFPTLGSLTKNIIRDMRKQIQKRGGGEKVVEIIQEDQVSVPPTTPISFSKEMNTTGTLNTLGALKSISSKISSVSKEIIRRSKQISKILIPPERFTKIKKFIYLKWNQLFNKIKSIPELSKWLLIFVIIFVVLFLFSVAFLQQKQQSEEVSANFSATQRQIEEKTAEAESKIIIGDDNAAKAALLEAQSLLDELPVDSNKQKQAFQQLSVSIENLIIKLRKITKVDAPTVLGTITSESGSVDLRHVVVIGNDIYAFNISQNSISKIENGQISTVLSSNEIIKGIRNVKMLNGKITIYHENGFHTFDPSNQVLTPLPVFLSEGHDVLDFTTYNNRLYIIDATPNQIIRLSGDVSGYRTGVNWLTQPFDVSKIIGMGIDTNIWVMDSSGKISKLNKGHLVDFNQPNLEPALESPTQFFTSDETNFLYILEPSNRRIVVFDKEGNLETQYFSENFDDLRNFYISERNKTLYLVNGNSILSIPLSHLLK